METRTKTIVAATMAALAVPGTALATDPDRHRGDDRGKAESRSDRDGRHEGEDGDKGRHGHGSHGHGWRGHKGFVVSGVDAAGLTVTDGKLAGPITLDPQHASRGARKLLDLTKAELRGEDTVTFGTAGDAVVVTYHDLAATDALQPTDRVTVIGKVRDGRLDVKLVKVQRPSADEAGDAAGRKRH